MKEVHRGRATVRTSSFGRYGSVDEISGDPPAAHRQCCCYDGMSSEEYTSVLDGSSNLVVIRNSLWRLQAMDQAYSGPLPNHNAFWKWSAIGPKLALYDNVFRADEGSEEGKWRIVRSRSWTSGRGWCRSSRRA